MLEDFQMFDGLDFNAPDWVRLDESHEVQLTRHFAGSPSYQHHPGARWRLVATPRLMNDDLLIDRMPGSAYPFVVGEVLADMDHEPPELVQIISLRYTGP